MLKKITAKIATKAKKINWLAGFIALVCIAWLWGSVSAMSKNWDLARQVESKKREKALLALEMETLELENKYYASAEYQELAARRQHGKLFDGEKLLVLPENSVAAKTKYQTKPEIRQDKMTNFEQWMAFLFGWRSKNT